MSDRYGFTVVRVLPEIVGKPWNGVTLAYMRALRPSKIRIVRYGQVETTDAVTWRVTVHLNDDELICDVVQEVEVDLPDGIDSGYALQRKMEAL